GSPVCTSSPAARRLITREQKQGPEHSFLLTTPVYIAEPGTDPAPRAGGTDGASGLPWVAAVTPGKGHAVLVDALAAVADRPWTCVCAGPLDRAPEYVDDLRARIERYGLAERAPLCRPPHPHR